MCLKGEGQIEIMDKNFKPLRFEKRRNLFLPADLGRCLVAGDATILKIRC